MFNPFGKSQLLSIGKDAKGRFHMGLAGFSGTWGKRGLEKFTTPGLSIKRGKSGDMKLHRLGTFGVAAKFGDAGKGKGVYFKDFNMLGIHRRKGDDGQIHMTGFMGIHREADEKETTVSPPLLERMSTRQWARTASTISISALSTRRMIWSEKRAPASRGSWKSRSFFPAAAADMMRKAVMITGSDIKSTLLIILRGSVQ